MFGKRRSRARLLTLAPRREQSHGNPVHTHGSGGWRLHKRSYIAAYLSAWVTAAALGVVGELVVIVAVQVHPHALTSTGATRPPVFSLHAETVGEILPVRASQTCPQRFLCSAQGCLTCSTRSRRDSPQASPTAPAEPTSSKLAGHPPLRLQQSAERIPRIPLSPPAVSKQGRLQ